MKWPGPFRRQCGLGRGGSWATFWWSPSTLLLVEQGRRKTPWLMAWVGCSWRWRAAVKPKTCHHFFSWLDSSFHSAPQHGLGSLRSQHSSSMAWPSPCIFFMWDVNLSNAQIRLVDLQYSLGWEEKEQKRYTKVSEEPSSRWKDNEETPLIYAKNHFVSYRDGLYSKKIFKPWKKTWELKCLEDPLPRGKKGNLCLEDEIWIEKKRD